MARAVSKYLSYRHFFYEWHCDTVQSGMTHPCVTLWPTLHGRKASPSAAALRLHDFFTRGPITKRFSRRWAVNLRHRTHTLLGPCHPQQLKLGIILSALDVLTLDKVDHLVSPIGNDSGQSWSSCQSYIYRQWIKLIILSVLYLQTVDKVDHLVSPIGNDSGQSWSSRQSYIYRQWTKLIISSVLYEAPVDKVDHLVSPIGTESGQSWSSRQSYRHWQWTKLIISTVLQVLTVDKIDQHDSYDRIMIIFRL